ncbi:gamma-glutamylcyclotransferase [Hyphomicrobium sp.]|uniref:gamma-glutamylcyclotransferase n=1 Tax=Hyphomicrobium sp. TaxID=82 RepID=UPI002D1FB463|nr:gamma-glutamylcyclotransferase [Hyphomicrobium sp.]
MPVEPAETWIFGYGSLMWSPGFAFAESRRAKLAGFHRAFCVYSIHYRGTERRPGLVLGLDRGGACEGIAFRVAPEARKATLAYLRARELIYGVYREALVPVDLGHTESEPPRTVWATAYIAERCHPAYAGRLPLAREAHLIRRSIGQGGTNLDYLVSTRHHLLDLGIREPRLERLIALTGAGRTRQTDANGSTSRSVALARAWAEKPTHRPTTVRDNRFGYRAKLAGL